MEEFQCLTEHPFHQPTTNEPIPAEATNLRDIFLNLLSALILKNYS